MDRGAWQTIVHGATKSQTRLSDSHTHTHTHTHYVVFRKVADVSESKIATKAVRHWLCCSVALEVGFPISGLRMIVISAS